MEGMGEAEFFPAWAYGWRVLRFPGVAKCYSITELSLREVKTMFYPSILDFVGLLTDVYRRIYFICVC